MAAPIIPPTEAIVSQAIAAIVQAQPQAAGPIQNGGKWSAVPAIVRAQTDISLARVAHEVRSARLRFAKGPELRTLSASEFNYSVQPAPQSAIATLVLGRSVGKLSAGVIKKGSLFGKPANPNAYPVPQAAATYQSLATVYVPLNATLAIVPCIAVTPGADANVPTFTNTTAELTQLSASFIQPSAVFGNIVPIAVGSITPLPLNTMLKIPGFGYYRVGDVTSGVVSLAILATTAAAGGPYAPPQGTLVPSELGLFPAASAIQANTPLFDTNLTVIDCDASGGAPGITDPGLVAAARANAIGQYGPTDGALIAGVLTQQSIGHYAFFRATGSVPYAQAYVADPSWASSGLGLGSGASWVDSIAGSVAANQQGFGCRVRWGQIVNALTAVSATIYLTSTDALAYTQDIDTHVRAAIRAYFDDRQDWYLFRLKGLASAIRNADPNIQQVGNVVVSDAVTGQTIAEPTLVPGKKWSPTTTHYYVGASDAGTDNTCTLAYMPPA